MYRPALPEESPEAVVREVSTLHHCHLLLCDVKTVSALIKGGIETFQFYLSDNYNYRNCVNLHLYLYIKCCTYHFT